MITPALFPPGAVHAYDLRQNVLPGVLPTEEPAYWRDVGTIHSWWRAHMDLLGRAPLFDLDNLEWAAPGREWAGALRARPLRPHRG